MSRYLLIALLVFNSAVYGVGLMRVNNSNLGPQAIGGTYYGPSQQEMLSNQGPANYLNQLQNDYDRQQQRNLIREQTNYYRSLNMGF